MNKMIVETNNKNRNVCHPVLTAILAGEPIESWKIIHEFTDDHLPCVTLRIKVGTKTYTADDCWLSYRGMVNREDAETSKAARKRVIREWKAVWKDAQEENEYWDQEEAKTKLDSKSKKK